MKKLVVLNLLLSMLGTLSACESGYFERVGKKTDGAVQKADDLVHDRGFAQKVVARADKQIS